jgi:hypothetical protein
MGAGTETYVRTVALALAGRDHEVSVYSPFPGKVAEELAAAGIRVEEDITALRHEFFAVAHVHHNVIATQVRATFPQLPIVWVRHGIAPELERPPAFIPEVTLVVAPERAIGLTGAGHNVHVVPNPIDTSYYAPRRPIRRKPKTAVAITNHLSAAAWATIEQACDKLRIAVRHIGYPNNNISDVRDAVDGADVVFGVGRTALEAGSMARAVLIHDHNGCDGWLDRANYAAAAEFAFSGHRSWHLPSGDELADLIKREYSTEKGREARALVVQHHALDVVVPELERHYRRAVEIGRETLPEAAALAPTIADQVAFYQREIQTLRAELDSVYGSRSWRLLAPLRRLNGLGRMRLR